MGKLRTSILNLQKLLVDNPARQEKVEKELEGEIHNVNHIGQTADEGWNQLFIQLSSKFEDEGTTVDANKSKTLKEVLDKSFVSTIKGIESFRQDIFRACGKFTTVYENGFGQMKVDLAKAEEEAKALRAIAMKKKAKWLASTKYKDKIKGYLEVIDSVDQIIASQKKSLAGIKSYDQTWATKNFPAPQAHHDGGGSQGPRLDEHGGERQGLPRQPERGQQRDSRPAWRIQDDGRPDGVDQEDGRGRR